MKILVISQVYWPDNVSVAQQLSDLCEGLVRRGHSVTVLTGRYDYENPSKRYVKNEKRLGVNIVRMRHTGLGKVNNFARLLDFVSFNFLVLLRLLFTRRKKYDLVIGLTTPPLLSFIGVWAARLKGMRFCYWTMDLQPELAIASGLLRQGSLVARALTFMGDYAFRKADRIIALDRFMKDHVVSRGAEARKVDVIPVWPVMQQAYEGRRLENPFRIRQGFGDKIVVMYSGNHSFVHPLDTLLNLALDLREDDRFVFAFIGGGVRKKEVTDFKEAHKLENVVQLPYQPRSEIHISLAAADFQVVILGEEQVGYTHPSKIYGAMFIGRPIIYDGPSESHVTDIIDSCEGNIAVRHGQVGKLRKQLLDAAEDLRRLQAIGDCNRAYAYANFHPDTVLDLMYESIESIPVGKSRPLVRHGELEARSA